MIIVSLLQNNDHQKYSRLVFPLTYIKHHDMDTSESFETGCCPRFHPEKWDGNKIKFTDKIFLKDHVTSFFHIPLNYGQVMKRNMERMEKANAISPESIVLNDENSLWGSDVYIEVKKEIPHAEIEKISGTFLTKVFEGPYKNMNKYVEEMKSYVQKKDQKLKKLYFYYTYCPKCAKDYGQNYTVLFAQI